MMKFSKTHEYVRVDGQVGVVQVGVVGISQFAVEQLGDVVYVELPDVGRILSRNEEFGVVESVKAVSSLYAPVSGEVLAVNGDLRDHPEWVNQHPYGQGWLLRLAFSNLAELDEILSGTQYEAEVAGP